MKDKVTESDSNYRFVVAREKRLRGGVAAPKFFGE